MTIIRKNPKLGNYMHYLHQADARHAGYEQIVVGYRQVQTGEEEVQVGEDANHLPIYETRPVFGDDETQPIYEDGDDLFAADWDEAWGTPVTDEELAAWEEPQPEPPPPLTDVDIARQYQQAYQAAEGIIFLLMGRVAPTLIQKKYCTPENVNAEGTKFMQFHRDIIQDFKNSGRHPDAGDEMYDAFVNSKDTFPWVEDETILTIFATTIPRNPT